MYRLAGYISNAHQANIHACFDWWRRDIGLARASVVWVQTIAAEKWTRRVTDRDREFVRRWEGSALVGPGARTLSERDRHTAACMRTALVPKLSEVLRAA